jgi:hypothetical protein
MRRKKDGEKMSDEGNEFQDAAESRGMERKKTKGCS